VIYFDLLLFLVVLSVAFVLCRTSTRIVIVPTPADQVVENEGIIEISNRCTRHRPSFWRWRWKDENGEPCWIPRLERITPFWGPLARKLPQRRNPACTISE